MMLIIVSILIIMTKMGKIKIKKLLKKNSVLWSMIIFCSLIPIIIKEILLKNFTATLLKNKMTTTIK